MKVGLSGVDKIMEWVILVVSEVSVIVLLR